MHSLDNAVLKLTSDAKDKAIQIRDDSKKLERKLKSASKELIVENDKQTKKIKYFLNKHRNHSINSMFKTI